MDLYPDNGTHNLKLDWRVALPLTGRASGGLSFTRMTQDDALIAPVVNSCVLSGGAGVFLGAGPQDYTTHTVGIFLQYAPGRRENGGR